MGRGDPLQGILLAGEPPAVGLCLVAGRGACSFEVTGRWWAAVPADERPDDPGHRRLIEETWEEPFGDRRQEIVLIGQAMDRDAITAALDACLLTGPELAAGPGGWGDLEDPFPTLTQARPAPDDDHDHEHAAAAAGR